MKIISLINFIFHQKLFSNCIILNMMIIILHCYYISYYYYYYISVLFFEDFTTNFLQLQFEDELKRWQDLETGGKSHKII